MGKIILAIDDDEAILAYYKTVLGRIAEVRTARGLAEARPQLPGADLILLDFDLSNDQVLFKDVMQELAGVAPILLCSGVQDPRVPFVGGELGTVGYWNKQSGREALFSLVKSTLRI